MSSIASHRPNVLLAMDAELTKGMFDAASFARLSRASSLLSETRFTSFEGEAHALLDRAEVLLTGWGAPRIDEDVLAISPELRAIIHCGGSVKPLVTKACFERGLAVSSAATANAISVAEFTLAAILWGNKRVVQIARDYAGGRCWPPPPSFEQIQWEAAYPGLGNHGKRIGVVGASRIGRRVISLLQHFDFEVLVFDPYLDDEEARRLGARKSSLEALCMLSDTITLHAPELESTRHMIGASELARMKGGATLINTARASLVDMQALERELESGRLFAILDCTDPFQLPKDAKLHSCPNAFLTPHIAGALGNEKARLLETALDELERWARGEPFAHAIRLAELQYIA